MGLWYLRQFLLLFSMFLQLVETILFLQFSTFLQLVETIFFLPFSTVLQVPVVEIIFFAVFYSSAGS